MENATKALLIAAAILIAIIIISLGIAVVNQGREAVGNADLSEAEIEAFNSKFLSYEGSSRSAADVNALLSQVLTHNQTETQNGKNRLVTITDENSTGAKVDNTNGIITKVSEGKRYTVTCVRANGLVTTIKIKSN